MRRILMEGLLAVLLLAWASVSVADDNLVGPNLVGPNLIGTASCATATCHGAAGTEAPMWSRSFEIHLASDPHARAGIVLTSETSRRIVERLSHESMSDPVAFDNVLRTRCISCHATVEPSQCEPIGSIDTTVLAAGVSCESCHGPASDWGQSHFMTGWDPTSTGFRDNDTLLQRADNCVRCHIGSRRSDGLVRDVNHDLIAAGHPPLRFDLLRYTSNQSRHWNVERWADQEDWPQTRLRLVGSAVSLATAADLSAERLSDHQSGMANVPQPELADYDCFGCHRTITPSTYQPASGGASRGLPVWNAWHSVGEFSRRDRLASVRVFNPLKVPAEKLLKNQKVIASYFRKKSVSLASDPLDPTAVVAEIDRRMDLEPDLDWNMAANAALTLRSVAMDRWTEPSNEIFEAIDSVDKALRFDSRFPNNGALSPGRFDSKTYRRTAEKLIQLLSGKKS